MGKIIAACLFLASQSYSVPPAVLLGIYQVEGGRVGQEVGPNKNGSYDLGPMQINTIWLKALSKRWGVSQETVRRWVRDDPCTNLDVAAWILKGHLEETRDISKAISHYHSRTPVHGVKYRNKVVLSMKEYDLIKTSR